MSEVFKVFLSSTGADLTEWREVVAPAVNRTPGFECINMETWLPDNRPSRKICEDKVEGCEIFVGLIGFHYGSRGTKTKSWTRLEYEWAKAKDRRMFVAPYGTELPNLAPLEPDDQQRQIAFRKKIQKDLTVAREHAWENAHAMAVEVMLVLFDIAFGDAGPSQDRYEATLQIERERIRAELQEAARDERAGLQQKLDDLSLKTTDIEAAYASARETISGLREEIANANWLDEETRDAAEGAVADEDFEAAEDLLADLALKFEDYRRLEDKRGAAIYYQRGKVAAEQVRWHDAAQHYARAAELDPSYDHLFAAREFCWRTGGYGRAVELGEALIKTARTEFGEDGAEFAGALNEHAQTLHSAGNHTAAEALYRQAIKIVKATYGEANPDYATDVNNLAALLQDMGRFEEAEALYRQAIEIDKATIGETHPEYAVHLNNLAHLLRERGRLDEAEPLFRQAIEIGKATLGGAHPHYASYLNNLARLLQRTGRKDEAAPLFKQSLDIVRVKLGDEDWRTIKVAGHRACLLRNHFPEDPALTELEETFGPDIGKDET